MQGRRSVRRERASGEDDVAYEHLAEGLALPPASARPADPAEGPEGSRLGVALSTAARAKGKQLEDEVLEAKKLSRRRGCIVTVLSLPPQRLPFSHFFQRTATPVQAYTACAPPLRAQTVCAPRCIAPPTHFTTCMNFVG